MTAAAGDADRDAVERLVAGFFAAFADGPGLRDRMNRLRASFLPEALIVRACGAELATYDVDGFIAPRAELLSSGTIGGFSEWPVDGRVEVFGDIAQWFGSYAKSWEQDGERRAGRGMKSIQCVRTPGGWRISAVAWDDER